jgi:hypothetical protein
MPRMNMLTDTTQEQAASEFAESIPVAPAAGQWKRQGRRPARRNREWEKAHRPHRYVNVPIELREQVTALAEHLVVSADEVARAFIEYGIECFDEEILQVDVRPNPQGRKMTLFPQEQAQGWQAANNAPQQIPARRKKKAERVKKVYPAVSYRLPEALHNNICGLAMDLGVPLGEVVTLLLGYGLEAYQAGRLRLNPQPVTVKMTLQGSHS